uniref:Uncharacterized protein n=1 Tax=Palpitomonas bilix TaxID=652834 RepID=A0A7S3G4K2_9EUKA|mmetsp:Transcript_25195/g.63222  ORF Transcript_25195/g.63222 Transcript_25195/m.63222 type:complete len:122 (+) Transcript_25195:404-769(+)
MYSVPVLSVHFPALPLPVTSLPLCSGLYDLVSRLDKGLVDHVFQPNATNTFFVWACGVWLQMWLSIVYVLLQSSKYWCGIGVIQGEVWICMYVYEEGGSDLHFKISLGPSVYHVYYIYGDF